MKVYLWAFIAWVVILGVVPVSWEAGYRAGKEQGHAQGHVEGWGDGWNECLYAYREGWWR